MEEGDAVADDDNEGNDDDGRQGGCTRQAAATAQKNGADSIPIPFKNGGKKNMISPPPLMASPENIRSEKMAQHKALPGLSNEMAPQPRGESSSTSYTEGGSNGGAEHMERVEEMREREERSQEEEGGKDEVDVGRMYGRRKEEAQEAEQPEFAEAEVTGIAPSLAAESRAQDGQRGGSGGGASHIEEEEGAVSREEHPEQGVLAAAQGPASDGVEGLEIVQVPGSRTRPRWGRGWITMADEEDHNLAPPVVLTREQQEERARKEAAAQYLRGLPMGVKVWHCWRVGGAGAHSQPRWTEHQAIMDTAARLLLLKNLQFANALVESVCLGRECTVEFLGEKKHMLIGRHERTLWAIRMQAPLRRRYTIALGPKEVAVSCFRELRAASLHEVYQWPSQQPSPPAKKKRKRPPPPPSPEPPPPSPRPGTVCVDWDGPNVGIVPLASMWSSHSMQAYSFTPVEPPPVTRSGPPLIPFHSIVVLDVALRCCGRRWRRHQRGSALIAKWLQRKTGHSYLLRKDVRTLSQICFSLIGQLGMRGGVLGCSERLAEQDEQYATLRATLVEYCESVAAEVKAEDGDRDKSLRAKSTDMCMALVTTLDARNAAPIACSMIPATEGEQGQPPSNGESLGVVDGDSVKTAEQLREEMRRQAEALFWELSALVWQRGWTVPWLLWSRVATLATRGLWYKGLELIDGASENQGDGGYENYLAAQRIMSRLLELQRQELVIARHVGDTDQCIARVGLACCLILRNKKMPLAMKQLREAAAHLRHLQMAEAAGVKVNKREVIRFWKRQPIINKRWRRVASKGLRFVLLLNACQGYKFGRCRLLQTGLGELSYHSYWQQRHRSAALRAERYRLERQLKAGLHAWKLCLPLRHTRQGVRMRRLRQLWRHWRVCRLVHSIVRESGVRCVSTCLTLAVKFRRKAILADHAATVDHEHRTKAATLIQSRMRGFACRLAIWRGDTLMESTFTNITEMTFVDDTEPSASRSIKASLITGRHRDMRKGMMVRYSPQQQQQQQQQQQIDSGGTKCCFYASVTDLMHLLRFHAPPTLRVQQDLKQVCKRVWTEKLLLLPASNALLEAPEPELGLPHSRGPKTHRKRVAACFVGSVMAMSMLLASTRADVDVASTKEEERRASSVTRTARRGGNAGGRGERRRSTNASTMTLTGAFLPQHHEQEETERETQRVVLEASATMAAQGFVFLYNLRVLQEDLLRRPLGLLDPLQALQRSSAVVDGLEQALDRYLVSACDTISREEERFAVADVAVHEARQEAVEVMFDTCRRQDALRGRKRAKLGPGAAYGLYVTSWSLRKRKSNAHALFARAREASKAVDEMKAQMRGHVEALTQHRAALQRLSVERRVALQQVFQGAMQWRQDQVTAACDDHETLQMEALQLTCMRRILKRRRLDGPLSSLAAKVDAVVQDAEDKAQLAAHYATSCVQAMQAELLHAHTRVLRTLLGLRPGARCRQLAQDLSRIATVQRLVFPLYRKQEDIRARTAHEIALAERVEAARQSRLRRVSGAYERKLQEAVLRPRVSAETHWKAVERAVQNANVVATKLRTLVMDYQQQSFQDEDSELHPLLYKAYGRVDDTDNIEMQRLKSMQATMRDDLAGLLDAVERRESMAALSMYWGVVGRTYRGEAVAKKVAEPAVALYQQLRKTLSPHAYHRFQYILRLSGEVPADQPIRLPPLPDEAFLSKPRQRFGGPLTSQDMKRLHPILPWNRYRLMKAATRIQRVIKRKIYSRRFRLRCIIRLQCWTRRQQAFRLLNTIRIQRWYRSRRLLRPLEIRAKQRAAVEKRGRRLMRSLHVLFHKEMTEDGYWYYRNGLTGQTQWQKPAVFGEEDGPYDAPTPRTHKRIVRLCLSGPQVWYPRTLAVSYGVYGGRTEMHELEAASNLIAFFRRATRRTRELRLQQGGGLVQPQEEETFSSGIRDLMALTHARKQQDHQQQQEGILALAGGGGGKRKKRKFRNRWEATVCVQRWWRRHRARWHVWRLLPQLYRPRLHIKREDDGPSTRRRMGHHHMRTETVLPVPLSSIARRSVVIGPALKTASTTTAGQQADRDSGYYYQDYYNQLQLQPQLAPAETQPDATYYSYDYGQQTPPPQQQTWQQQQDGGDQYGGYYYGQQQQQDQQWGGYYYSNDQQQSQWQSDASQQYGGTPYYDQYASYDQNQWQWQWQQQQASWYGYGGAGGATTQYSGYDQSQQAAVDLSQSDGQLYQQQQWQLWQQQREQGGYYSNNNSQTDAAATQGSGYYYSYYRSDDQQQPPQG